MGSHCLRAANSQAYLISCANYQTGVFIHAPGECEDSEICIDGRNLHNHEFHHIPIPDTAYCVSINNFVEIALERSRTTKDPSAVEVASDVGPGMASAGYAMEAVMTGLDHKTSLFMHSLKMQAQTLDVDKNRLVWRTLDRGMTQCTNCSSLALGPLPIGTQRVKVDAVLKAATAVGLLYLASVAPP